MNEETTKIVGGSDMMDDLVRNCPHCGKVHRLVGHDMCLKNPDYDYLTGTFGKNINPLIKRKRGEGCEGTFG